MIKLNPLTNLFAVAMCFAVCSISNAQEAVTLQEDGSLAGKAVVTETSEAASDAKMTLTQDGEVVSTVNADDQGNFAFQNIEPGSYQVLGAADPFIGQASYDVAPFSSGGCSSCSLGLSEPTEAYSSCSSCSAQSFSSSPCGCGGGGGFGGGGGLLGGGGGGGLLSSRLFRLGAVGGIVAIAVSDDDDDASPDN